MIDNSTGQTTRRQYTEELGTMYVYSTHERLDKGTSRRIELRTEALAIVLSGDVSLCGFGKAIMDRRSACGRLARNADKSTTIDRTESLFRLRLPRNS